MSQYTAAHVQRVQRLYRHALKVSNARTRVRESWVAPLPCACAATVVPAELPLRISSNKHTSVSLALSRARSHARSPSLSRSRALSLSPSLPVCLSVCLSLTRSLARSLALSLPPCLTRSLARSLSLSLPPSLNTRWRAHTRSWYTTGRWTGRCYQDRPYLCALNSKPTGKWRRCYCEETTLTKP